MNFESEKIKWNDNELPPPPEIIILGDGSDYTTTTTQKEEEEIPEPPFIDLFGLCGEIVMPPKGWQFFGC